MSKRYSVTILLAAHNRLELLQEAVGSSLTQDYPDFEVLIVDDGSAEETRTWLARTESVNDLLRVVYQEQQGVATARARGIKEARKDLICILDSDDQLLPDALGRIVREFEMYPDTDLVYVNIRYILPDNSYVYRPYRKFKTNSKMRWGTFLLPRVPFKHSGTTYRRDVALALGGYDVSLPLKVDIDLFLKFLAHGKKLRLIDGEPLVDFRVHSGSLSLNRTLGLKVWFQLIDRYGPRNPVLKWGAMSFRAFGELAKFFCERIQIK